jgi:hypothetical protein
VPVSSYIVEEGPGKGRGHVEHGNGKGLGHQKHGQEAAADGEYTLAISGINHQNHTPADQTSAPTTLADGSTMNTEVRQGSITIDEIGGVDALHLVTDSNNGRLRLNTGFDADQRFTLGELDDLSFDSFIDASDRTDVIPVVRLIIDADGNPATLGDRGELVFEYAYQGLPATTQDSWQTADLDGDDWVAWQRSNSANHDEVSNMTGLSDWADDDGFTAVGGINFNEDSLVLGFSVALGSGNGTNDMYIDNLQVGGVTYDFIA